jgi:hypothetical protein
MGQVNLEVSDQGSGNRLSIQFDILCESRGLRRASAVIRLMGIEMYQDYLICFEDCPCKDHWIFSILTPYIFLTNT